MELLPRVGYICRNGYTTSIFSGEAHLRVHAQEGIGIGSIVSRSHVITPAHLTSGLFVLCFWLCWCCGLVLFLVFAVVNFSGEL